MINIDQENIFYSLEIDSIWKVNFALMTGIWIWMEYKCLNTLWIKHLNTFPLGELRVFTRNQWEKSARIMILLMLTSANEASHVKAWIVWLKVLGPCFLGSSAQFTWLFANHIVKALTFPLSPAGDIALIRGCYSDFFVHKALKSHAKYAYFCLAWIFSSSEVHSIQRDQQA